MEHLLMFVYIILMIGIIIMIREIVTGRHRCKICKRKTKKICRLSKLPNKFKIPGISQYLVYVFRECVHDHEHVTIAVKTVMIPDIEVLSKPKEESDWSSSRITDLCYRAGVQRPIVAQISSILIEHPTLHIHTSDAALFKEANN